MRIAVCRLIEAISIAHLPLKDAQSKKFLELLEECIKNPIDTI